MIKARSIVALCVMHVCAAVHGATADAYFSGTVVDSQNQPLAGATVQAGHPQIFFGFHFVVDGQATTDSAGSYAITTLASAGSYILAAEMPGYATQMYPSTPCYVPFCLESPYPLKPTVVPPLANADFQLIQSARVSGHFTQSATNEAIPGALIFIERTDGLGYAGMNADLAGNYSVEGLYPGEYRAYTNGFGPFVDQIYAGHNFDETMSLDARNAAADLLLLAPGDDLQDINFALDPGATLSGTVLSALSGEPLNATVNVRRLDASGSGEYVGMAASSDHGVAPGTYSTFMLAPGSFHVSFGNSDFYLPQWFANAGSEAQAQEVTLTLGQMQTGVDALLTPTRTIAGTVTEADSHAPLPGRRVEAGYRTNFLAPGVSAVTDANGHYVLQGLQSGTPYTVWVDGTTGYPSVFYSTALDGHETTITLGASDKVSGIDIDVPKRAYASGRVFDPQSGWGSPNLLVQIYDANGNVVYDIDAPVSFDEFYSDATGHFHTAAVPPGVYYLGVNTGQGFVLYPDKLCNYPCDFSTGQLVNFPLPEEKPGLDIAVLHLDDVYRDGFD